MQKEKLFDSGDVLCSRDVRDASIRARKRLYY
jgi:hypothetical protein